MMFGGRRHIYNHSQEKGTISMATIRSLLTELAESTSLGEWQVEDQTWRFFAAPPTYGR